MLKCVQLITSLRPTAYQVLQKQSVWTWLPRSIKRVIPFCRSEMVVPLRLDMPLITDITYLKHNRGFLGCYVRNLRSCAATPRMRRSFLYGFVLHWQDG